MAILQLNSQGDDVKSLQQQLSNLGYPLTVDGIFGIGTQNAVKKFQYEHKLLNDGIAGTNTMNAINALLTPNDTAGIVKGIDISHNNGTINWATLAQEVSFVYCKASQGAGFKDHMFESNFSKLSSLGILHGAYHFLNFKDATAQQQIDNFLGCGVDFSQAGLLPPVLDVEWQVPDTLNPYVIQNRTACVQLVKDWLTGVASKTRRIPMIYTNRVFWHDFLGNPTGFENYPLWIAAYQSAPPLLPPGWDKYTIWQNSGTGTIKSVSGQVDKDIFNGTKADLEKLAML
ncbi:hypothetical protein EZ428_12260 [Pedobacter frigiditerrae]|uniref:Peptidoglycan binding-like domain-containing protein n=1 Tax=Pedobacter frigiditerrae TaxID=2530452 RepID=A0A4V2MIE0_9SPHI|nr:GH25 family lysozyme [Pedobacter frigiditerrae]TCC90056.1 hypothetical protein EZ428_12260 [Pedobacter frigiditerrae]